MVSQTTGVHIHLYVGNVLAGAIVKHYFFPEKIFALREGILWRDLRHNLSRFPESTTFNNKVGINKKSKPGVKCSIF